MSSFSCLYSAAPNITPMLCIRSGVSCTGASGASVFCCGIEESAAFVPKDGPEAAGWTSSDIAMFVVIDGFVRCKRYTQIPARIASTAIQTREVLKTYLFIAVSLLSGIRDGLGQLRDLQASVRIRASN